MDQDELKQAAEALADAVEDFVFTTDNDPETLKDAWRSYVHAVDHNEGVSAVDSEVKLGDVPPNMTMYRCSPDGIVVRFVEPNHWVGGRLGTNYPDEDVKGWAVAIWTTPFEECEPYYPLFARNHSDDVAELIALRRQVKELQEQLSEAGES